MTNNWIRQTKSESKIYILLRLFSPGDYFEGVTDPSVIWNKMGKDIDCIVHDNLTTDVFPPNNFNPDLPTKVLTHGFSSQVTGNWKTDDLVP